MKIISRTLSSLTPNQHSPRNIYVPWRIAKSQLPQSSQALTRNIGTLARLWIMAERFLMPRLQNHAMNCIYSVIRIPDKEQIVGFADIAYAHLEGENQLAKVLQSTLLIYPKQLINACADELPKKLLAAMLKTFKDMQTAKERKKAMDASPMDFHVPV